MTNISRIIKSVALILMLAGSVTATSATSISLDTLSIAPGQTKSVGVILDNEETVGSLQFCIALPEGLDMASETIVPAERIGEDAYTLFADILENGSIRFTALDNTGEGIQPGKGIIFYFSVVASEALSDANIVITDAEVVSSQGTDMNAEVTDGVVQKDEEGVVEPVEEIVSLTVDTLAIAPGETKEVSVKLYSTQKLGSLQFSIALPPGLVMEDGSLKAGSMLGEGYTLFADVLDNGAIRFSALDNTGNGTEAGEGELLSFTVSAADTFTGGIITMEQAEVTTPDGENVANVSLQSAPAENSSEEDAFGIASSKQNLVMENGETAEFDILLTNVSPLLSFQCLIELPEGIEFAGETPKASLTPSERMKGFTLNVQQQKDDDRLYKVIFTTLTNKSIEGPSGQPIFTVAVKATTDELTDAPIIISAAKATNSDRQTVNFDGVTVMVNDTSYQGIGSVMGGADGESTLYTLGGTRVTTPVKGSIYVVTKGNKAKKVMF